MPRKKKSIEEEVDSMQIEEDEEQASLHKKKSRKSLPKEKGAPWPRREHRFEESSLKDDAKPSLRNFIVGAVFLALLAYGTYYVHMRYDLFSFIRSVFVDSANETEMTYDLNNLSEGQQECLEDDLGQTTFKEIQTKTRSASLSEQDIIQNCLTMDISPQVSPTVSIIKPGDLPVADELAVAKGVYKWCLETGLGDAMDTLIEDEREPTVTELEAITYCQTYYWDEDLSACLPSDSVALTELGKVITYESAGLESGFVAGSTAVVMADGRIRVYFEGGDNGIMSAISSTPVVSPYDSLELQVEGTVINPGYSHPRAIVLGDGRTRLFVRSENTISSFISDDGFNFVKEEGVRITGDDLTFENITGVDIVSTDEGFRMYIGNASVSDDVAIEDRPDLVVKSAVSRDMFTWTVEEGIRLGAGSGIDGFETDNDQQKAQEADHPSVLKTDDDNVLVAFRSTYGSCVASSSDGISFDRPLLLVDENLMPTSLIGGDLDILYLEPNVYLITSTGGGSTKDSFISAGILRIKQ
ncbi:hypothetical protein KC573_02855 [candidate division WWE3 bacterium]|uniref:Uncharacterized protein n=1 Tax=candidate division WWE3 bacterium TaxID=2053526 RepID=A0A955LWZ7_UNCKA|nr:hypothetical protein [candidate division WWE3 bacterium]